MGRSDRNRRSLTGRVAVVPGASRPIGRAIARQFGKLGANLVLPWHDWPESVDEMNEEFTDAGYSFLAIECDLRQKDEVVALVQATRENYSSTVDYLINNVERGGMPVVHGSYDHSHNDGQWELEIDTTLKAKWNLYHYFKPLLLGSEDGAVINLSSIAGETGRSGPAACFFNDAYSAANRAVSTFTETWARELSPAVRVNEIILGLIESRHGENTRGWSILSGNEKQQLQDHTLLGRRGTPDEVADLVLYISTAAKYMTGSCLRLDGGYLLGGAKVPGYPPGIL